MSEFFSFLKYLNRYIYPPFGYLKY